ncbi:Exocyst complex component SEC3 [Lecanosticta acicola]|uniref:Exocyst complex component SEC3 n=1 Tax=Lecanosticta acicola TaxID=111012 RepID=A0AAI9E8Q4_9PEZI|nr:Exocyst complex component SEC3 [Lecanosticta acicola]
MSRPPNHAAPALTAPSTPAVRNGSTATSNTSNTSTTYPSNPSMNSSGPPPSPGPGSERGRARGPPSMSRAERFEDEKRRIMESCFSKLDQNGQLTESYITHIRIIEDAAHPSSPPPPDSPESNKKPRLIIIAVRSTGRVRMHKARENMNGSFSIGKTWNMEELCAIESYSHSAAPPQTEKEAQYRNWAGNVGFTVTVSKPYYWQAGTTKEKDFFIASAVKIYRKYTKGQVPELKGFDEREKAVILGGTPQAQQQPPPPEQSAPQASRQPSSSPAPAPPQPPYAQRDQSQEGSRYRQSPGPPPSISDARPSSGPGRRPSDSPARFGPPPQQPGGLVPGGPRPSMSSDQLRANSRDGRGAALRPGTSPGERSPAIQRPVGQPPPSPMRTDGFGNPPMGGAPSPLRPQSPPRKREMQAIDGASEERRPSNGLPVNGLNANGASLFNSARQRYLDYQPQPSPTTPKPSQLPPIETSQAPAPAQNGIRKAPTDAPPESAQSESPAGINLDHEQTIGGLTGFWGPEHSRAATPTIPQEPEGSDTPERSRYRPQMGAKASQSSVDLRPAPLSQARNPSYTASQRLITPRAADASESKLLQSQNKSETSLPLPGAFSPPYSRSTVDSTPAEDPEEDLDETEAYRPGLGPMFKKKAIADRFKKAANAASAFKPRPGGAAERILQAKAERDGEPDGITGVVPRPASRPEHRQEEAPATPVEDLSVQEMQKDMPPTLEVSSPQTPLQSQPAAPSEARRSVELFDSVAHLQPAATPEPAIADEEKLERQIRQPQVKSKRRSAQQEKYLAALDIDRSLLEGKGLDFEMTLSDFGWSTDVLKPKQLAILEADVRREHGQVEAGSWLSHTDAAREERVAHVESLLDKAIAECDELDGLLTLYNVELSTLNDDIAFIEAQSQGLQVQSANQKLLQTELQTLVDTMSLDRRVLEPIRYGDLADARNLEDVEGALIRLYRAMLLMDPSMSSRQRSAVGLSENETSNMAALREKKATYDHETQEFCKRLMQFLDTKFSTSMNAAKSRVLRVTGGGGLAKLNSEAFTEARNGLWMYVPLITFTRELNPPAWQTLLRMYYSRAAILYSDAFKENLSNWKRAARATTGEDTEILFTAQEKEDSAGGGLSSTARKLTVKRSQTLAKTLRNAASGDKHGASEPKQPGAMSRSQAFAGALDEMAPLMSREQNFFVDLFHAHSLETEDFEDAVHAAPPSARRGTNLLDRKPTDPDRGMAQLVNNTMGEIFDFFGKELNNLLNWSISEDPLQGVGIMACLSRHGFYLHESSQEYLLQLVRELSERLQSRFNKFIEEQVRAVEDTKVKIKKRKGVIAFMKMFPHFSAAVENNFASVAGNDYDRPAECMMDVRRLVDEAYERINRAMFDSLKVIAKESPVAGGPSMKQATGDDPEDKEMLNYHILLIENMNHYVEEVDDGTRQGVLAEWRGRAQMERAEALEGYVARVIRRPLGKLLDFLESAESILSTNANPSAVSSRPSYSRKAMRTLLSQHDGKEIRRGIDTLRKRIEKHFGDADEEAISRTLVGYVCKECERAYERTLERTERLAREVYPPTEGEKNVEIDFSRADIQAGFRR